MMRRFVARFILCSFLFMILSGVFGQVYALADTEKTGYWKLKETKTVVDEAQLVSSTGWQYSASATELTHTYKAHLPANRYHEASTGIFTATCSPPPQVIQTGDKVVMSMELEMQDNATMLITSYCVLQTGDLNDERNGLAGNVGVRFDSNQQNGEYKCYMDTCENPSNATAEVYHVFNETGKPGSEMAISFYGCCSSTLWIYEWIDTTPAKVPETSRAKEKIYETKEETQPASIEETTIEETEPDKWIDIVVDSTADKDPGSTDGGDIPSGIVNGWKRVKDMISILGGGAVAIAGAAMGLSGLSDDGSGEEEEKTTYRMMVYKEFGDTINRGEEVIVYACIMENDPLYGERVNHKLTSQISIFSEDDVFYVKEQATLAGDYKGARVKTSDEKGLTAMEGAVSFKFTGKGGTFTNRMKFKIAGANIFFGQDNMALPHNLKEHVKPWFVVTGMANKPEITVEIAPEGVYDINVTEAESTGISGAWAYYANIIPRNGAPSMEEREPGAIEVYKLHVTAEGEEKQVVEADLPVLRVRTGLTLTTKYVDCFWNKTTSMQVIDEKDGGDGTKWFKTIPESPVYTEAEIKLIVFDLKEHRVRVVAPVLSGIEFYSDDGGDNNIIKRLGIFTDAGGEKPEFGPEGGLKVRMLVTKNQLDAPRRIMAKVRITAEAFGKTYTAEQDIQLCSQPNRSGMDFAEFSRAVQEDDKIRDRLVHLQNYIQRTCYDNLFPLHRMITDLVDSYDPEYGFDKERVGFIYNTFNRYSRGYIEGANGKPDEGETLSDYALWTICSVGDAMDRFEGKFGFLERLLLGVATCGQSELIFTGFDLFRVPYRMIQALERGHSDVKFFGIELGKVDSDSVLGLTVAGAHDLVMGEVQGRIISGVFSTGWSLGKELSQGVNFKIGKNLNVNLSKFMTATEKALENYNKKVQNYRSTHDIAKGLGDTFEGVFKSKYKPDIDPQAVKTKAIETKIKTESISSKTDALLREYRQSQTGKSATEHGFYVEEMPDGSIKAVRPDLSDPMVAKRYKALQLVDNYKKAVRQEQQAFSAEGKAEAKALREKYEFEIREDLTAHDILNEAKGLYDMDIQYIFAENCKKFDANANKYACEYTVAELKKTNPKIKDGDVYMRNLTTNKDNPYKTGKDLDQTQMMKQGEGLPDIEVQDTLQYRNNVKGVYKAKTGKELTDVNFKEGEALYEKLNCETVAGEGQFAKEKFSDVDGMLNPDAALREIRNAGQNAKVMELKTQIFIDKANATTDAVEKAGFMKQALYATKKDVNRTIVMRNNARIDRGLNDLLTETDKIRIDALDRTVDMEAPKGHLNMMEDECWGVLEKTGIKKPEDLSKWMNSLTLRLSVGE